MPRQTLHPTLQMAQMTQVARKLPLVGGSCKLRPLLLQGQEAPLLQQGKEEESKWQLIRMIQVRVRQASDTE